MIAKWPSDAKIQTACVVRNSRPDQRHGVAGIRHVANLAPSDRAPSDRMTARRPSVVRSAPPLTGKRLMTAKNPHAAKNRIRRIARHAQKMGRILRQPCQVCGDTNAQKHHPDYNQPLIVEWLCPKHHMAVHAEQIPDTRGELNGQAKLTAAQAVEIRARYESGRTSTAKYARSTITRRQLAIEYGVSKTQVTRIVHGTRWASV